MKSLPLIIFYILNALTTFAQIPDSFIVKYNTLTSGAKINFIYSFLRNSSKTKVDYYDNASRLLEYFNKREDEIGITTSTNSIAEYYFQNGDNAEALNNYYKVLNRKKLLNDTTGILDAYINIIATHDNANNFADGIAVTKSALNYVTQDTGDFSFSYYYCFISNFCAQASLPDSGILYAQKAIAVDEKNNNKRRLAFSIATLAENYIAKGENDIALPFLKKAMEYSIKTNANDGMFAFLYNDYVQIYLAKKQYDSIFFYAQKSLTLSNKISYQQQKLRTYEYLYTAFDQIGKPDSALKYYKLATNIKENNYSVEKAKAIEATKFKQIVSQKELEEKQKQVTEERKQNIQYILIAVSIVTLLIVFFLLSHSIIVNEKWVSFFSILGLLIVFEFINLFLHPFLERVTHHNQLLMLLALVLLASLLIPLHHKLEKWIKEKLVEKNKRIRLAQAKKTIAELENND